MTEPIETTATEIEVVRREPLEFVVNGDFVKQLPKILSNIEEIKAEITERTEADRNLILTTEEDFDNARKRCAELNKVNDAIDKKRKEVKKEYAKPYEQFEKALKDTMAVITSARDNLWSQIQNAEQTVKDRKEEQYKAYFEKVGGFISPYRTWEQIFRKEWLNKSYAADKVKVEIDEIVSEVESDVKMICDLKSPFHTALIDKYRSGSNLRDVIAYNIHLQDAKMYEDRQRALSQTESAEKEETPAESNISQGNEGNEETVTIDFRVTATRTQLKQLGEYMRMNNITYGRVPRG